jgi:hypothetical protein
VRCCGTYEGSWIGSEGVENSNVLLKNFAAIVVVNQVLGQFTVLSLTKAFK